MEPGGLRAGDRLDRYELLCPLAYGGMAAVWLARHRGHKLMDRLVVIKTILPQFAGQEQFQAMFMDEARVASAIDHPNVARILDVGEADEMLFLAMEWIDGESLSRLQRAVEKNGSQLPAGVVLRILADVCAGLHAAHELRDASGGLRNVVHRDVSPQNILVATSGVAKVIDFGVAKARDRVTERTNAGELKGKIRYMSPEQALGRDVDRRADVWSLGAVMFEMLARVPPYDGPNEVATLHLLTSGVRPAPLPPSVPHEVAAIVERALQHDRERRFATAAEMQHALESAMSALDTATTTSEVGAFLETHLAARAHSRKRSIDEALAAAAKRERGGAGDAGEGRAARGPFEAGMGILDPPSQTSTATLGSAAVEWPQGTEPAARRRRGVMVFVGMAVVLGLIGVGAVAGRLSSNRRTVTATPPPSSPVTLPPPAGEPTLISAPPVIESLPAPTTFASPASPPAYAAPASTAATAATSVTPASAADTAGAEPPLVDPAALPLAAPRPRPVARPAPAPPRPAPATTNGGKKRDYGF